ncbi:MAG: hypothetical protein KAG61_12350 [Bacteriovoracaceae bacterium]|nr:hypothetical protein [Bacteriovoracaceae bacterium]
MSYTVASEDQLPLCSSERDGMLYYLNTAQSFRVCSNDSWNTIDVKGEPGEDGESGASRVVNFQFEGIDSGLESDLWCGEPFDISGITKLSVSYIKVSGQCSICTGAKTLAAIMDTLVFEYRHHLILIFGAVRVLPII